MVKLYEILKETCNSNLGILFQEETQEIENAYGCRLPGRYDCDGCVTNEDGLRLCTYSIYSVGYPLEKGDILD